MEHNAQFIQLTQARTREPIWINRLSIVAIAEAQPIVAGVDVSIAHSRNAGASALVVTTSDGPLGNVFVIETAREILDLVAKLGEV